MVRFTLIFALWWSTDVSLSGNWGVWVPNSAYGIKGQNSLINCTFWYPKEQTLKLRKWLLSTKNEVIVVAPSEGNSLDRYIIIGEGEKRQCTLLISNTTLEDEEIYKFRFETDKDKWSAKDKTKLYISGFPTGEKEPAD
ncbi:sialoadhesin-like [Protopterus annectens]|uniref:sialoadhesin-like n=1 Tax=Protopterus annectens TaxID=7888 RepID=UPI001CFB9978|nr:sialoadhesin-like [Protopterus annectens]